MVDQLGDTFRWWTGMGAFLAMPLIVAWAREGLGALEREQRIVAAGVMLVAMIGFFMAGVVIPFASSDRVAGFDQGSLEFRQMMAGVWFCWGCAAWGTATAFAAQPKMMLGGSITWLCAAFMAAGFSIGAML